MELIFVLDEFAVSKILGSNNPYKFMTLIYGRGMQKNGTVIKFRIASHDRERSNLTTKPASNIENFCIQRLEKQKHAFRRK